MSTEKNENKVDISLVIDDAKTARCSLNLNEVSNDVLLGLSEEIGDKFNLDDKTKTKLYYQLKKKIVDIVNLSKKKKSFDEKREELFNRLYYEDMEKKKKIEKRNERTYRERMKKELEQFSFTPQINSNSNKLFKQNFMKIEDRLYSRTKRHGIVNKELQKIFKNRKISSDLDFNSNFDEKISNKPQTTWHNNAKTLVNLETLNDEMENKEKRLDNNTITEVNNNNDQNIFKNLLKSPNSKKISKANASSYLMKYEKMHNTKTNLKELSELSLITSENGYDRNKKDMTTVGNLSEGDFLKSSIKTFRRQKNKNFSLKVRKFTTPNPNEINENKYHNTLDDNNNNIPTRATYKAIQTEPSHIREHIDTKSSNKSKASSTTMQRIKRKNEEENHYTYIPTINQNSKKIMEKRKESKEKFIHRLMLSKRISETQRAISNLRTKKRKSINKSISTYKPFNTEPSKTISDKKRINEKKKEIEMLNTMKEIEKVKKETEQYYKQKTNKGIENYKLNRLKEIYEILNKEKGKIDFDSLADKGIPMHIKEKVVIPTCLMINQKGLEFNFQNFYLISSEILNNYY